MKISLLGFMGTGKTATAKILARKMGFSFIDTDERIKIRTGQSISQLFAVYGEKYFRKLESEVLKEIIESEDEVVIATGGGIVISPHNRELLLKYTRPVLLTASAAEILKRVKKDGVVRPLLADMDSLQRIKKLLQERKDAYRQFELTVATDGKDPSLVAEEIIAGLGVNGYEGNF